MNIFILLKTNLKLSEVYKQWRDLNTFWFECVQHAHQVWAMSQHCITPPLFSVFPFSHSFPLSASSLKDYNSSTLEKMHNLKMKMNSPIHSVFILYHLLMRNTFWFFCKNLSSTLMGWTVLLLKVSFFSVAWSKTRGVFWIAKLQDEVRSSPGVVKQTACKSTKHWAVIKI